MKTVDTEQVFHELADALTRSGQPDFFPALTARLGNLFGVDHVMIARLDQAARQAHTLAVWSQGQVAPNFSYALHGTPCETVPDNETCEYPKEVDKLFPNDAMLAELGVKSYFGVPVLTPRGDKLGVFAILHNAPVQITELWREALRIAAAQVGAELDRREQTRLARQLTHSDGITGLPNRLQLQQYVTDQIDQYEPFALALFDLTRFKEVNDLHGHALGDEVLRELADRMVAELQDGEFLARHSGDEFAWVLRPTEQEHLKERISDIRAVVQQPLHLKGKQLLMDVSVGVAWYPEHGDHSAELARHASIALARAKKTHDKYQVFTTEQGEELWHSNQLLNKFRQALTSEQLELHYQPLFNLSERRLVGAEALCRWHDAELGQVSPATFIPLVEERGLAAELGSWVMRTACQQLRCWRDAGTPLPGRMCINLSATELDDPNLAERLTRDIQEFPPGQFCIELTESAVMSNPQTNIRLLSQLSQLGFQVAIDDFGTGYSSLSYLTRFHAKVLKVDKSFTLKMPESDHNKAIVETILAMCRTLGLTSIAEGVETSHHADLLLELGCEQVQGYHFGRPVAGEEFARNWLSNSD